MLNNLCKKNENIQGHISMIITALINNSQEKKKGNFQLSIEC